MKKRIFTYFALILMFSTVFMSPLSIVASEVTSDGQSIEVDEKLIKEAESKAAKEEAASEKAEAEKLAAEEEAASEKAEAEKLAAEEEAASEKAEAEKLAAEEEAASEKAEAEKLAAEEEAASEKAEAEKLAAEEEAASEKAEAEKLAAEEEAASEKAKAEEERHGFTLGIKNAVNVNNQKITADNAIEANETFILELNGHLTSDHNYRAEDKIKFNLPAGVTPSEPANEKLIAGNSAVANYTINNSGVVEIEFLETAEAVSKQNMALQVKVSFDTNYIEKNTKEAVINPIADDSTDCSYSSRREARVFFKY
ncbi:hypothetical protein [Jeotgalicoccus sp. WY2]|uniref:hypothetical protein n=1 Tax=Jeotgalicoccus sp. WY2 TaxID=2708346 RepID=UPI001BD5A8C0|nr:hypothetical protein [Jeotgalicoccus sp. WY2]